MQAVKPVQDMPGEAAEKNTQEQVSPTICLLGTRLDVANMGCRALTVGALTLFERFSPKSDIRLLYGNRTGGKRAVEINGDKTIQVEVVNCRLSPRSRSQEHLLWLLLRAVLFRLAPGKAAKAALVRGSRFLESLERAAFVGEIFGGDSFSDIYGLSRFLFRGLPTMIAILLGKKPVLLPQTYGPYRHWITRVIARYIIRHSARLYARDLDSMEAVRRLLGSKPAGVTMSFCPDVAFALEAIRPADVAAEPALTLRDDESLVGVNISGLLFMGGYTHDNMFGLKCAYGQFVRQLLQRLLDDRKVHVLLVPHTFESDAESDLKACREVFSECAGSYPGRLHLLAKEYDQSRLKYVIGQCEFFIGSRMHACIAALSQGVPSVGVAYSRKFKGVFESVGMGGMVVDARELDTESCTAACMREFKNRQTAKTKLLQLLPELRRTLFRCFAELVAGGLKRSTNALEH